MNVEFEGWKEWGSCSEKVGNVWEEGCLAESTTDRVLIFHIFRGRKFGSGDLLEGSFKLEVG